MKNNVPYYTLLERAGFIAFLTVVTIGLVMVTWPFAAALLWATLAAIIFQPLYLRILSFQPRHESRAAAMTLLIIFISVIVPTVIIGTIVVEQATNIYLALIDGKINAAAIFATVHDALPQRLRVVLDNAGFSDFGIVQEKAQTLAKQSAGLITRQAVAIGGSALSFAVTLGVGLYITYFLIRDGQVLGPKIRDGMPLEAGVAFRLGETFTSIVRATIKGSVIVGLVQGAIGAATFWIVGIPSALFFGLLMAIFSLLPAVGTGIVWLPVAIYLLATGAIWQGVAVTISGVAIIGMADNLLRPILVGRDTGIPDWIVLVTTLGGIASIGLSGIILGPLLAGLFIAGWTILKEQRDAAAAA